LIEPLFHPAFAVVLPVFAFAPSLLFWLGYFPSIEIRHTLMLMSSILLILPSPSGRCAGAPADVRVCEPCGRVPARPRAAPGFRYCGCAAPSICRRLRRAATCAAFARHAPPDAQARDHGPSAPVAPGLAGNGQTGTGTLSRTAGLGGLRPNQGRMISQPQDSGGSQRQTAIICVPPTRLLLSPG
jgi:hypothetical protein